MTTSCDADSINSSRLRGDLGFETPIPWSAAGVILRSAWCHRVKSYH